MWILPLVSYWEVMYGIRGGSATFISICICMCVFLSSFTFCFVFCVLILILICIFLGFRSHNTHIDFLRLLFLVGMICPLMQEHFLRPLLKRKSLPLRLNKSFRLFSLLQSASWIWIAKGDILLSVNVMVSFNLCHAGPSSFSIYCTMLNFRRKWFTDPNFEEWIIGTHFVKRDFLSKKNSDH